MSSLNEGNLATSQDTGYDPGDAAAPQGVPRDSGAHHAHRAEPAEDEPRLDPRAASHHDVFVLDQRVCSLSSFVHDANASHARLAEDPEEMHRRVDWFEAPSALHNRVVDLERQVAQLQGQFDLPDTIDGEGTALLFLDQVFRQHGLPEEIVSDRGPRFTARFWKSLFQVLGTRLDMSTADHPQTDGQTERVNRAEAPRRWSEVLPLVEFALNNAVDASIGFTPFYVNGLANPRVLLTPPCRGSGLSGRDSRSSS
ncbi:hypothetical protein PI124_g22501 [Phytophthora idaei]|nr:hypothetical protein PI126_g17958 [Phytophthora idaei]KAG3232415.1 hypothetical protein PI124_g22501 [Phytophthora idaei]